jgi:hypothetical protein
MRSRSQEDRMTALEGRVGEIETNHGKTLYDLKRYMVRNDLRWAIIVANLNVKDVTEKDVDEVLDAE